MSCIVCTTVPTISPPLTTAADAPAASWLAWPAVSALVRTVPESSSIDAAVCCRLPARSGPVAPAGSMRIGMWLAAPGPLIEGNSYGNVWQEGR